MAKQKAEVIVDISDDETEIQADIPVFFLIF
jgi:hypothetical protein